MGDRLACELCKLPDILTSSLAGSEQQIRKLPDASRLNCFLGPQGLYLRLSVHVLEFRQGKLINPLVSGIEHESSLILCDLLLSAAFFALSLSRQVKNTCI